MPKFYFDVDDNGLTDSDQNGIECKDINEAKMEAITAVVAMLRDAVPDGDHHEIIMSVRGEDRSPLMRARAIFDFEDVAPPSSRSSSED